MVKTIDGHIPAYILNNRLHWAFNGSPLLIHDNPCYIDSMGEDHASVSGEIDVRIKKDPMCSLENASMNTRPDPTGFDRWLDLVAA